MPPNEIRSPEPAVSVAQRILSARDKEVAHYAKLYPLLLGAIDEIMVEWNQKAEELPWSVLKNSERQNDLAHVITRVIDCAMSSASREERVQDLIGAAIAHGEYRRSQELEFPSIFREYDKIRNVTWEHLKRLAEPPTCYDAIFVIDGLLSVASRGTMLGYHRKEMQEFGLWDSQRAELAETVRS